MMIYIFNTPDTPLADTRTYFTSRCVRGPASEQLRWLIASLVTTLSEERERGECVCVYTIPRERVIHSSVAAHVRALPKE